MLAGTVVASLLPLSSAKPLGVDSAEADASESESRSGSSTDMHGGKDDADAAVAARCDTVDASMQTTVCCTTSVQHCVQLLSTVDVRQE